MTRKFSEEDLKREITEEFNPLRKKAREIEEFFEENIRELSDDVSKEELLELKESIRDLRVLYSELKDLIFEMAGFVGDTEEGKKTFDIFERIDADMKDLESILNEILGILKPVTNNTTVETVKADFIKKYNEIIQKLREFFMERLYDILDTLQEEVEKEEIYFR